MSKVIESKRLNLCLCVRLALVDMGVSSVQVVNAINATLGRAKLVKSTAKLGAGKITKKKFAVTESESNQWELPRCIVTTFDAWHSKIEAANKVAPMTEALPIPAAFHEWLAKFKADQKTVEQEESEQSPEEEVNNPDPANHTGEQ